jgi:hypothetical protein
MCRLVYRLYGRHSYMFGGVMEAVVVRDCGLFSTYPEVFAQVCGYAGESNVVLLTVGWIKGDREVSEDGRLTPAGCGSNEAGIVT